RDETVEQTPPQSARRLAFKARHVLIQIYEQTAPCPAGTVTTYCSAATRVQTLLRCMGPNWHGPLISIAALVESGTWGSADRPADRPRVLEINRGDRS